jgi:hypothetical protein
MIDSRSTFFRQVTSGIARFTQANLGGTRDAAAMRSAALLISHTAKQAFVKAVCDDFLIAAMITIAGILPILILKSRKYQKAGQTPAME